MRLTFAFALVALTAAAASASDFNIHIDEAGIALQAFDVASARVALDRACPAGGPALLPEKTAICEHYSGVLAEALGNEDEAAAQYRGAVAQWEKAGPSYLSRRVSTLTNLGNLYWRGRRFDEAQRLLLQALDLSKPLALSEPALRARVTASLGTLYGDLGQPEHAFTLLEQSTAALRALPDARVELGSAESSLGMLELHAGRYKAGESDLREAVNIAEDVFGEQNPETAAYSTNLALALMLQGQFNRAETLLRRARFVIESRLGADSIQLVNTLGELSSVERELGHFSLAENSGEKALRILHAQLPAGRGEDDSMEMVLLEANLGNLYVREHKLAEAEKVLPAAVAAERRLFNGDRALADGLRNLASLRAQQGAWKDADSLYREAIELYERKLGPEHPDLAPVLRDYAAVLKRERAPKAQVKNIEARARSIAAG
jgi:tetratricopeptide (TPR) repeat protein